MLLEDHVAVTVQGYFVPGMGHDMTFLVLT
jgi:hypothetical protein